METTVKERLIAFLKSKHIPKSQFEKTCGLCNGYVNGIRKGIGTDKLLCILNNYPEINREWLLFGEGEMIKSSINTQAINQQYTQPQISNVKQRLIDFIYSKKLSQQKFENICGLSNGYVNNIKISIGARKLYDILQAFPELNRNWLLFGEGEMLNSSNNVTQQTINQQYAQNPIGNINGNAIFNGKTVDVEAVECTDEEVPERLPIVPTSIAKKPSSDTLEMLMHQQNVELAAVRVEDMPIEMWYRIQDDSLEPNLRAGDLIALHAYPQGKENPVPGKLYAVDTCSNGLVVRVLYPIEGGYRAKAYNSEDYPDFIIYRDDIIRIYKKMVMVRF